MRYNKFLQFMNLLVLRPFKVMATINALASLFVGALYIWGPHSPVAGGKLYTLLSDSRALFVWAVVMMISSLVMLVALHWHNRCAAGYAATGLTLVWIYATLLVAAAGNFIFSVPFLMFPLLLSCYVKLKISLDEDVFMR